jgi:hypothetical protein
VIAGNTLFSIGATNASVDLSNQGNDFTGSVSFDAPNGLVNLTIFDNSAFELGASTILGNLQITAVGNITQSVGAVRVDGIATLSASGATIDLDDFTNDFNEIVILVDTVNVLIRQGADPLTIEINQLDPNVEISGFLAVTAAGDVFVEGNGTDLDLGATTITGIGNLDISGTGALTNSGVLDIAGTTRLEAGANTITFAGAGNVFAGVVTVDNSALAPANLALTYQFETGSDFSLVMTNLLNLATLEITTPVGVTAVTVTAPSIVINADVMFGTDDILSLNAENLADPLDNTETITSDGGELFGSAINLYADGVGEGGFAIGSPNKPIIINITAPSNPDDSTVFDGQVNLDLGDENNPDLVERALDRAFGFVSAPDFNTAAFTDVFNRSQQRVFIIGRFDEIVSGVQGSFITAPSFSVDSSQFRTDLNIFGVDGSGVLLPRDQCEDEESTDCAR